MHEERQFRFLIPPFFCGLSSLAGAWFSGVDVVGFIQGLTPQQLLALGAAVGAAALPIGFFLTSISLLLLRLIAICCCRQTYEVVVPRQWLQRIWPLLRLDIKEDTGWLLYAAATFDHELVPSATHAWIQRRWSIFHVSAHSAVGVLLSHSVALFPAVRETCSWVTISVVCTLILGVSGFIAWYQVMRMLEFQSHRHRSVFLSDEGSANPPLQPTGSAGG